VDIDFAALEKEIAEQIAIQRRREQLHDTKALAHLRDTARPFVNYIRRRLIETAKIDDEPTKRNRSFTFTVFILTASQSNIHTYNNVVSFGMETRDDEEFVWFVGNEQQRTLNL
jgi:hypothetical protein